VLVLSRRSHESIRIGDTIVVTVLEVRGDHVRLGIDAPNDVEVHRQEVYEAIQGANVSAASPTPVAVAAAATALRQLIAESPGETGAEGQTDEAQQPAATGGTSGAATS
jgi:carbon storage regulator